MREEGPQLLAPSRKRPGPNKVSVFLLSKLPGFKGNEVLVFKGHGHFYGVATYLTIFHIGLLGHGTVQKKGNFFPAVRTLEKMFFHRNRGYFCTVQIYVPSSKSIPRKFSIKKGDTPSIPKPNKLK